MTIRDTRQTFEADLSRAVGLLMSASRQIDRMPPADPSPVTEYERLHLSTGALLAAHRARHLLPADLLLDEPIDSNASPTTQVIAAHELLTEQLQGVEPFEVLELVADVGNLCQDMRRHDRLH